MNSSAVCLSMNEKIKKITTDFSKLENWEDKYKKIIEMGRSLPEMPEALKSEDNKVKGCQSQVWLHASLNNEKQMLIQGDSDALIVKGLVAVLLFVYSQEKPSDILQNPPDFIKELGFESHLSPSRSNGLFSMIKQIKNYAIAFDYFLKSQP